MWRKSYKTTSYKRTAKPKTYRNGFVKTAKSITVYLQGAKLLLNNATESENGNWLCSFKVTKNSMLMGSARGIYIPSTKVIQITWKTKKYLLSSLK
jgi:hypothetical protein